MEVSSRRFGDVVVAAPAGRIDHANADALTYALAPTVNPAPTAGGALLLDFTGVDYISSVGLRVLMMTAKQMRAQQRGIGIAALQPVVREIFEISRFNLILDVFPTVRAGLEKMSAPALAAYDAAASAGAP